MNPTRAFEFVQGSNSGNCLTSYIDLHFWRPLNYSYIGIPVQTLNLIFIQELNKTNECNSETLFRPIQNRCEHQFSCCYNLKKGRFFLT